VEEIDSGLVVASFPGRHGGTRGRFLAGAGHQRRVWRAEDSIGLQRRAFARCGMSYGVDPVCGER